MPTPIDRSQGFDRPGSESERQACEAAIVKASSEWGFFQVLNHGISHELLDRRDEERTEEVV